MHTHLSISRHFYLALILCLIGLLVACRRSNDTQPSPTASESTATLVVPTETQVPPTETPIPPTKTPVPSPTPAPTETPAYTPVFEEASCQFQVSDERDVECGYLTVPENRADPNNGKVVRLHVAIFASNAARPEPDPIIYLEGGPGGDALEGVPYVFEDRFAPFLENRDFIMFDQRGTGYSETSLACPEYTEMSLELLDDSLTPEEETEIFLETMEDCRKRLLDEGVDLAAYDSAANAADVDDLRQALGYEQWNLYGISYGTRLALTVMRDHPEGIRSVILDSAYPLEVDIVLETPRNFARALDVFFDGCAADPLCDEAYPDLETTFFDLVDEVNAEPISVPVFHAFQRREYTARLDGNDLLGVVFQSLYSEEIIPLLPQFINDTAAGDYELLSGLLANLILSDEFISIGMNFSVQCQDEIAFANPADVARAVVEHPELESYFETSATSGETAFSMCALWDVPPSDAIENRAVESDIPTLVLAGEYDPITPPGWGEMTRENLPNSYYYEFPGLGHGVSVAGPCPQGITMAFLDDPRMEPDADCIEEMAGPAFVVPSTMTETVEMVPFEIELMGTEVSGLVPEGWEEVSPGVFARQKTVLDQTFILQQAGVGIGREQFLSIFGEQIGVSLDPEAATTLERNGRSWMLHEAETQGILVDVALAEEDVYTYIVVLFSHPNEREHLYEAVFLSALSAIQAE